MHKMYFIHVLYISKDVTILAYCLCYEIMQKICNKSEVDTQGFLNMFSEGHDLILGGALDTPFL